MANPRPKVLVTESEYRKAEVCFLSAAGLECNTARGSLIDEDALFAALAQRRLAGAALDVFGREPYAPMAGSGDLRSLANVILTPHVSSKHRRSEPPHGRARAPEHRVR